MKRKSLFFNIVEDQKIACEAGVIEKILPKSCFFQLSSHFETEEIETCIYELNSVIKGYKRIVQEIVKEERFRDKFILAIDIPKSFKETGNAYITIEFTIFFNKLFEKKEIRQFLQELHNKFKEYINTINTFEIKSKIPYAKKSRQEWS